MKITSPDFSEGGMMPAAHAYDKANILPGLSWEGAPAETKSLALTMKDPDAPGGNWDHWLVYDIPAGATGIPRGGPLPSGAKELSNGYGKKGYGGPCPPSGTHRYIFVLYALDVGRLEGATQDNFLGLINKHKIASAQVMGRYKR